MHDTSLGGHRESFGFVGAIIHAKQGGGGRINYRVDPLALTTLPTHYLLLIIPTVFVAANKFFCSGLAQQWKLNLIIMQTGEESLRGKFVTPNWNLQRYDCVW
jgi:hypothetical protein